MFTGKGLATYSNGDTYNGDFVGGVSNIFSQRVNNRCRCAKAKAFTLSPKSAPMKSRSSIKDPGPTT